MADRLKYIVEEQCRQMNLHKWLESERVGHDLGDMSLHDWIRKYAPVFREWANRVPFECIECGLCSECGKNTECTKPFDKARIQYWLKMSTTHG